MVDILQLISQYGVVGILFYFGIKEGFAYLGKRDKVEHGIYGNKTEAELGNAITRLTRSENDIIELRGNHLHHQEKIEKQMEQNAKEHQEIFITLTRIEGKLDILKVNNFN